MRVCLEGPDGSGKSTLVEYLQKNFNMKMIHSSSETANDLEYHMGLLEDNNVVLDRANLGEIVYPAIYNRAPKMTWSDQIDFMNECMSKNVIYVSPDTSLTDAKALMIKEKINKLPVVDKSKKLVGIITKNDLQKAAPSSASTLDMYELGYLLSKLKVEKIMVKNVRTVDFDEVIEEAARTMATEKIGCLPVMKDGILSGIITETDLFNAFISMFGATLPGVRAVIEVAEKPGELARIATAVAAKNGNIVSVVTTDGSDVSKRIITVKIGNLSKETVEEIIRQENVKILDIREKK